MKKNLLLLAFLFTSALAAFSQSKLNLVIFSEDGDQFFAYVNGIRQNDKPETNVKITGLTSPNISLRIEFSDKTLPVLKQNMALETGYEHTAKIKRDMKKQLKLRYFGQVPIDEAPLANATTVQYHSAENSPADDAAAPLTINNTVTSTTTSTQTYSGTDHGNGNISINMGGAGITMNVSGMDPNATNVKTTTSTTVTSTNTSGPGTSSTNNYTASETKKYPDHRNNRQPQAKTGCGAPTTSANFDNIKQSVKSKPFSDTKMSTAKVATKNACLSVNQVKEICKLFNMDDEKMDYAKFAYDYCADKANYYQVSEVFSFSATTEEFNKFLEQK